MKKTWLIRNEKGYEGPCSAADILDALKEKHLSGADAVRRESEEPWRSLSEPSTLEELTADLKKAPTGDTKRDSSPRERRSFKPRKPSTLTATLLLASLLSLHSIAFMSSFGYPWARNTFRDQKAPPHRGNRFAGDLHNFSKDFWFLFWPIIGIISIDLIRFEAGGHTKLFKIILYCGWMATMLLFFFLSFDIFSAIIKHLLQLRAMP